MINCEINRDLNWSKKCVIVVTAVAVPNATVSKTDTKLYVTCVTLSTQNDAKLLKQDQVFKEQLTGIKINKKYQQKYKTMLDKTSSGKK